jgi:predicted transglutaminase-like cysteine proteinase
MPSLESYLFAMEAVDDAGPTASGLAACGLVVAGTGTCGVGTAADGIDLPLPGIAASGDWLPAATCRLPAPDALAATAGWHPAWGEDALPLPQTVGEGRFTLEAQAVLTPLFDLARCGIPGAAAFPDWDLTATSGLARSAASTCPLPLPAALAYACGLDSPVTTQAGSAAVVGLLCQGDPELTVLAAELGGGASDADALAATLLAAVAEHVAYAPDGDDDSDVWTCALGTFFRGTGDCEDGAILLHALLLAAGVPADRLVTAFGRVGVDRDGHAWMGYRRVADGRWVALDWTLGAAQGAIAGLPLLGEDAYYAVVDYALTAGSFFTVRQDAAVFFARSTADVLVLPALALAAQGALGGRAVLDVPAGLSCLGRSGGGASCRLARPQVAGTAGSAAAASALPAATLQGRCGSRASLALPGPTLAGQAGGSATATVALGRLRCEGKGRAGVLVAGAASIPALRARGSGRLDKRGSGLCPIPRLRVLAGGLPGRLAPGGAALPLPDCRGAGAQPALVQALLAAAALGARGQGTSGNAIAQTSPFDAAVGEEWQ